MAQARPPGPAGGGQGGRERRRRAAAQGQEAAAVWQWLEALALPLQQQRCAPLALASPRGLCDGVLLFPARGREGAPAVDE